MSTKVVWSWKDDYDWVPYDQETTDIIEKAYAKYFADKKKAPSSCELNHGYFKNQGGYTIDFVAMKQNKKRTNFKRNIKREGPPPIALPQLNSKQKDGLAMLFEKYKSQGVKLSESGETGDWIKGDGFINFQNDLGIKDEDPAMLYLLWKLQVPTGDIVWVIPRENWMKGFDVLGCHDLSGMKKYVGTLRTELKSKPDEFYKFYKWVFAYMKEEKSLLPTDEAVAVWELIGINEKTWPLMPKWLEFFQTQESVTLDTWNIFYTFTKKCPKDLSTYNENDLWPTMIDNFVEWMNPKKKTKQVEEEEEEEED